MRGVDQSMARTKQTARKNTGGKTPAKFPRKQPRKAILEYSSDDSEQEYQVEGTDLVVPRRVTKTETLMMPTGPTHMTLTESFQTFFMRHGITNALKKALLKRDWTVEDMQTFIDNYQARYGVKVPTPELYLDEEESENEGVELNDGSKVGKQAGKETGGKPKNKTSGPTPGGSKSTGGSGEGGSGEGGTGGTGRGTGGAGRGTGGRGGDDPQEKAPKEIVMVMMMTTMMMMMMIAAAVKMRAHTRNRRQVQRLHKRSQGERSTSAQPEKSQDPEACSIRVPA